MNIYNFPSLAFGICNHYLNRAEDLLDTFYPLVTRNPNFKFTLQFLQSILTIVPFSNFVFANYKYRNAITIGLTLATITVIRLSARSVGSRTLLFSLWQKQSTGSSLPIRIRLAFSIHHYAGTFLWRLSLSTTTLVSLEKAVKHSLEEALFAAIPLALEI